LYVFARGFGFADGLGFFILLALQGLGPHLKATAALFQLLKGGGIKGEVFDGQTAGNVFGLAADAFWVEHDYPDWSV
jgi:hypothetical protein